MNFSARRVLWPSVLVAIFIGSLAHGALAADPARGQVLWNTPGLSGVNMCSDCHGVTPSNNVSKVWNASGARTDQGFPSAIRNAISSQRDMFEFSDLTDTDLADLASYVNAVRYGKAIAQATLSTEECLFNWAEAQLPTVFKAPAIQQTLGSSLSFRVYSADAKTNAIGYSAADSQVWVLAPSFGFAAPAPLASATSASLLSMSRAAGCR